MNTFVTESGPLHHLHRAGFVVAPEMVKAHWAEAIEMDPQARELAIFRTNAARHLSGDELDRAVDAYADDLRRRDEHAKDCDSCGDDTDVLAIVTKVGVDTFRAAVERGSAIRSVAELDWRADDIAGCCQWVDAGERCSEFALFGSALCGEHGDTEEQA